MLAAVDQATGNNTMIPQTKHRNRTDPKRSRGARAPERTVPGPFSRAFKHPLLMHYHRLIALVVLVNGALLARHLARGDWHVAGGSALSGLADLTVVNFAIAVLIRQQHVLNAIFAVAGRGSSRWPLRLRWMVSKINHIGGVHVGAALAGTAWLCAFTVVAAIARASRPATVDLTTFVLAMSLVALMIVVVLGALPPVRARVHDVFELTHRFGGWTSAGLFWILTVHLMHGDPGAWQIWLLGLITASIVWPWLTLRRVPVTVQRPVPACRDRALRLRRHAGACVGGRHQPQPAARMARLRDGEHPRPIRVPAAGLPGGRLDVAVHRRPAIAPMGSRRSHPRTDTGDRGHVSPCRLRRDRQRHRPGAWCRDFAAEAVQVVSNKAATWRLVHGLERLGVPAFGPIWDS